MLIPRTFTPASARQLRRLVHAAARVPRPQPPIAGGTFAGLTVQALKAECRKRSLKLSGRKADLIERLVAFERSSTAQSAAPRTFHAAKARPSAPASEAVRAPAPAASAKPATLDASRTRASKALGDSFDGALDQARHTSADTEFLPRDKRFFIGLFAAVSAWWSTKLFKNSSY